METKYETKYSDDFQVSLLNSALDTPLRSSYIHRRLSLFSDDPNIRRLQASVRKDCLKINKKMMKQRQNMLSVKNLSRRKQKQIAAVDRVGKVASTLGVSREIAEQSLEMKKAEEQRKKDREDQLDKKLNMIMTEILSMKTAMKKDENEQTELILAKIDEIEKRRKLEEKVAKVEKPKVEKLTFSEQTQVFIESMSQDKTFVIHMNVVEAIVKLGSATLKQTLNYIGMGNYETNVRVRLYRFIQDWSKSLLTALKEMLMRPAGIGFKMGKMLFSALNPSQIPDIFYAMVKDIVYFVLGFVIIYVQFKVIIATVMLFDFMFGTGMTQYVSVILEELMHFCYTSFMDGVKLMWRTCSYIFLGSDPIEKSDTATDILRSDKRLWYVMRGFINQMTQMLEPLWVDFRNDKGVKPVFDWLGERWGEASAIWGWLKEMAGLVVEVVKKGAKFAANAFFNVGKTIAGGAKQYLPSPTMPDFGAISDNISNQVGGMTDTLKGAFWGIFKSTDALPAPSGAMLRPYTALTACGMLGITKAQFDALQNKKMVQYANNNPLSGVELVHVVYHANRELKNQYNGPTLRF